MTTLRRFSIVAAAATLLLTGCSAADSPDVTSGAGNGDAAASEPVIIYAAASLQASFDELAEAFTQAHPEYSVDPITYDGSQALATQIEDGADVDVVAFASEKSIVPLTDASLIGETQLFATNTLQIAVPAGNPKGIERLDDLTDPEISVVLCAVEVPCGSASETLLDDAGLDITPVSEETNVTSVVNRIENGEADAGLVYATDVIDAGDKLEGITPDNADSAINRYPIAVSQNAKSPEAAEAFVEFVLSDEGQAILEAHGFGSAE
jgi:molybdate transport system substrate-binding protein